jgi:hypothetical protein
VPLDVPTRLVSVYIRQRESARLVAVIELPSPINKRRGKGREEYLEKRRTFLTSPVHLIEIYLLRSYPRMPVDDPLPPAHYLVMVCKCPQCWVSGRLQTTPRTHQPRKAVHGSARERYEGNQRHA